MPTSKTRGLLQRLRPLAYILVTLYVVRIGLNAALGFGLKKGFSIGTDCIVELEDPEINFFPLSGRVKNAVIVHKSEPEGHGIRADEVSIKLDFFKLFLKRVSLRDLKIEGTRATSVGIDSGFFRAIDFFSGGGEPEEPTSPPSTSWHSWLTSNWEIDLDKLNIRSPKKDGPHLSLTFGDVTLEWSDIIFGLDDITTPNVPTKTVAIANDFRLKAAGMSDIAFGSINAKGEWATGLSQLLKLALAFCNQAILAAPRVKPELAGQFSLMKKTHINSKQVRA